MGYRMYINCQNGNKQNESNNDELFKSSKEKILLNFFNLIFVRFVKFLDNKKMKKIITE